MGTRGEAIGGACVVKADSTVPGPSAAVLFGRTLRDKAKDTF